MIPSHSEAPTIQTGASDELGADTDRLDRLLAPRLVRAFRAVEARDALALVEMADALWEALPEDLAPLIEEVLACGEFSMLSALLLVLPFERVQRAVPDFLLMAAEVDATLDKPYLLNLLIHRGGLRFRPRRRKGEDILGGAAARAFELAMATSSDRRGTQLVAEAYLGSPDDRETLDDARGRIRAPAFINFGDCVLAVTVGLAPEGLAIVSIDDTLSDLRASFGVNQAGEGAHEALAMDEAEAMRAMREWMDAVETEEEGTLMALDAELGALLQAAFEGDPVALRDPRVLRAWRAVVAARKERAFEDQQRGRERESGERAQSSRAVVASAARERMASERAALRAQRPKNGAELRSMTEAAKGDTLGGRLAAVNGRLGANPMFLSPQAAAASVAASLGVPAAALLSPIALVAAMGSATAVRGTLTPEAVASLRANAQSILGLTPLHIAAMAGNKEMIRDLLATGAVDPQALDAYGRSAFDAAVAAGVEDDDLLRDLEEGIDQESLREAAVYEAESRELAALRAAQSHAKDAPTQTPDPQTETPEAQKPSAPEAREAAHSARPQKTPEPAPSLASTLRPKSRTNGPRVH